MQHKSAATERDHTTSGKDDTTGWQPNEHAILAAEARINGARGNVAFPQQSFEVAQAEQVIHGVELPREQPMT